MSKAQPMEIGDRCAGYARQAGIDAGEDAHLAAMTPAQHRRHRKKARRIVAKGKPLGWASPWWRKGAKNRPTPRQRKRRASRG